MFDIFGPVKSLLKRDAVCIDNLIFKLHYKCTLPILIVCSLFITSRQYVGDPIDCKVDSGVPRDIMDNYCWTHSTYTLPDKVDGKIEIDQAHPFVTGISRTDKITYHTYYQWVCFVLFFQAILFFVPRYIWKRAEGGRMKKLVGKLNSPVIDEETAAIITEQKKIILDNFMMNLNNQNSYAAYYFICELLNLVNVSGQIFLMDWFLGYQFLNYGTSYLNKNQTNIDPMARVFPKVTKCTFNQYGAGGNIVPHDGLCLLNINIVNEKIYLFLWFWFITVTGISLIGMVYHIFTLYSTWIHMGWLQCRTRLPKKGCLEWFSEKCKLGDWFVLEMIGKNINPVIYKELIQELAVRLDDWEKL